MAALYILHWISVQYSLYPRYLYTGLTLGTPIAVAVPNTDQRGGVSRLFGFSNSLCSIMNSYIAMCISL